MNHYEEKKQNRIDYYRQKATEARTESSSLAQQSFDMTKDIPMGQPILVGHHSEQRDRNYRDRAWNKMGSSVKAGEKADYYERKANAAEKNNAISSDDPEALEKLNAKLERMQAHQEHMKKANAYYRKHKTLKGYEGISDDEAEKLDARIASDYSWQQQPYPAYTLQNNNQNMKRIKDRIKALESRDKLTEDSGWEFNGGEVVFNKEENRVQILFDGKPDENVRAALKANGFRWAPSQKAWQRHLNANGIFAAKRIPFIQPDTKLA